MTTLDADDSPVEVAITRLPLPRGEPDWWLTREVMEHGASTLPVVVMGGTRTERLLALETDREPTWRGAVEQALLEDPDVRWTAGWGTAMVARNRGAVMVTFAYLRERGGTVRVWVWNRLPGLPPMEGMAEEWLGRHGDLPDWVRAVVPDLGGPPVVFVDGQARRTVPDWPGAAPLPAPDTIVLLAQQATLADAARVAGQWLEARFVHEGASGPVAVAWRNGELAMWWSSAVDPEDEAAQLAWARRIGKAVARHAETLAVGLFGLGRAEGEESRTDESMSMIAVLLEPRSGDPVMWLRRFEPVEQDRFRWLDDVGEVRLADARLGWFE